MTEETFLPTRYAIITRNSKGKIIVCTVWMPFESYEKCNAERIKVRDRRSRYEVNIEYSWQD